MVPTRPEVVCPNICVHTTDSGPIHCYRQTGHHQRLAIVSPGPPRSNNKPRYEPTRKSKPRSMGLSYGVLFGILEFTCSRNWQIADRATLADIIPKVPTKYIHIRRGMYSVHTKGDNISDCVRARRRRSGRCGHLFLHSCIFTSPTSSLSIRLGSTAAGCAAARRSSVCVSIVDQTFRIAFSYVLRTPAGLEECRPDICGPCIGISCMWIGALSGCMV